MGEEILMSAKQAKSYLLADFMPLFLSVCHQSCLSVCLPVYFICLSVHLCV
jgi:hypothetical protein